MRNLFVLIILMPGLLLAQQPKDSLDYFIQKQVTDYKIPGLAIGIIKDNVIVFKKGYGQGRVKDSVPVTTQTIFPILSCTKAFTAAAIGILVDRGKLHWNDKIVKYLPNFKLSNHKITNELTISDILSHRSGLESFEGDLLWYGTNYSRQEIVRRIKFSPLKNNFRKDFAYQNVMYLVAGLIIEKVTGETWDKFIHKEIFFPLGMHNSSTSIGALKGGNYAHPHLKDKPIPLLNMDNIGPAGSINSSIDDMLAWLQLWMDNGPYHEKKILSDAAIQTITSPKIKVSKKSDESYGFGWYIEIENEMKILSHGGGMPGYKSLVIIIPQRNLGIVILTNKISYINEQLAGVIVEYLTSKSINWNETDKQLYGKNFRFSWDEESDSIYNVLIPQLSLYKGLYEDKSYGGARIEERDGKATLTLLPSNLQFTGRLYHLGYDKLKIVFNDGFVPAGEVLFYRKAGKVSGFRLNIDSGDFHFKYLNFLKK